MTADLIPQDTDMGQDKPPAVTLSAATVFGGVMLMLNLAALVWGAATVSASVSHTTEALREVQATMKEVQSAMNNIGTRVTVLEDRGERKAR